MFRGGGHPTNQYLQILILSIAPGNTHGLNIPWKLLQDPNICPGKIICTGTCLRPAALCCTEGVERGLLTGNTIHPSQNVEKHACHNSLIVANAGIKERPYKEPTP